MKHDVKLFINQVSHSSGKRQKMTIRKLSRNWLCYIKAQHLQRVVRMPWFNTEYREGAPSAAQKLTTVSMLCNYHLCHTYSTSGLPWGSILLNTTREVSATWRITWRSCPFHHYQDFSQHFHYTRGLFHSTVQATHTQNQRASMGWLVQTSRIPYPWA